MEDKYLKLYSLCERQHAHLKFLGVFGAASGDADPLLKEWSEFLNG